MTEIMGKDFLEIKKKIDGSVPEVKKLKREYRNRRRISLMFARMRMKSGLSKKDLTATTGWNKSFVSRLEGASSSMPDLETIVRFTEACGMTIGIIVCDNGEPTESGKVKFTIVDAMIIQPPDSQESTNSSKDALYNLDTLIGTPFSIPNSKFDESLE